MFSRLISLLIVALLIFSGQQVFSQKKRDIYRWQREAKEYFDHRRYDEALKLYKKLDSLDPGNSKYVFPLAICYIDADNNEAALPYFEECLRTPATFPASLYFYSGKTYQLSHKFEEAIKNYEIYKTKLPKESDMIRVTDHSISICKNALDLMSKPVDVEITNLGPVVNSPYPDYAPVISVDEKQLFFTSNRPGTIGGKKDISDGLYFEDVYMTTHSDTGWSEPVNMGDSINSDGHDACVSLTPDGYTLLLYRSGHESFFKNNLGDLFISHNNGRDWSKAKPLHEKINSHGWEPSACFSADEHMLLLASNKKGGYGGTDLYYITRLSYGGWSEPVNLGPNINTPFDEDAPWLHPDGKTLYFSSSGHNTMGGFDIFSSSFDKTKNEWSAPRNLGYPINTAHDDVHFALSADGKRIYFSSIRPEGYGDKDIYMAELDKSAHHVEILRGSVLDSVTQKAKSVVIKVKNKETNQIEAVYSSSPATGRYLMVFEPGKIYELILDSEYYELSTKIIDTTELTSYREVNTNLFLSKKRE